MLSAALLFVSASTAAQAQDRTLDAKIDAIVAAFGQLENGFKPSPECPIGASDWKRDTFKRGPLSLVTQRNIYANEAAMILTWYYSGAEAIGYADDDNRSSFGYRCLEGRQDCGLKKDKALAKALDETAVMAIRDDKSRKRIFKGFAGRPPDAAIAYASWQIGGRCFGDHPAQPTMEQMGMAWTTFSSMADCQANIAAHANAHAGPSPALGIYRWIKPTPQTCEKGFYAASSVERMLGAAQRELAFANRPAAERIAGLNACQIAYGLVYYSSSNPTVSKPPESAWRWAANYREAVIDNKVCPTVPGDLSAWLQAQPLTKFEPGPDPLADYIRIGPSRTDAAGWSAFIDRVVARYETPGDPQGSVPAGICADFHQWLGQSAFSKVGETRPVNRFMYSQTMKMDVGVRSVMCNRVPRSMFAEYQRDRSIQARWAQEATEKYDRRKAFLDGLEAANRAAQSRKPDYRPPAGEPRCYQTGEKTETCFYN